MNLLEIRDKLAAVLAPVGDDDPSVLSSLVDTITPPALMIGWSDPWLMPTGPCFQQGNLIVTAVAGRLVPGDGIATLEELVAYTLGRVKGDSSNNWSLVEVSGPRVFIMAKTNYLACRIGYHVTVDES
jgi:hypothetical protein